MRLPTTAICVALLTTTLGCAGGGSERAASATTPAPAAPSAAATPDVAPTEGGSAPATSVSPPAASVSADEAPWGSGPRKTIMAGTVPRAAMIPVLDEGLGRFLQRVDVAPSIYDGRFRGFRVVAFSDARFAGHGVEVGDVIERVNGKPIARPAQALAAFESLRTAPRILVELRRNGAPLLLRYDVID